MSFEIQKRFFSLCEEHIDVAINNKTLCARRYLKLQKLILQQFEDLNKAVYLLKASCRNFKPSKVKKPYTTFEFDYYDSLDFRFEKAHKN
jgi:hypothetical protein